MMRNKEVLNEIRKQSRTLIEEKRDKFVKQSLLSDEFIDMMQRNRKPFDLLMSYYQCAIMEIETIPFRIDSGCADDNCAAIIGMTAQCSPKITST